LGSLTWSVTKYIVNSKSSIVNKRAFTLIELLVVIAIIALLMAILVPVLRSARNQARAVVCQANLKQWGSVLVLYTEDNDGLLPEHGGGALWFLRGPFIADGDPNKPRVFQEIRSKGIACCPMAARTADDDNAPGGFSVRSLPLYRIRGKYGSTFEAWEIITPPPRFRGSYGFNGWLFDERFDQSIPEDYMFRRWRGLNTFSISNKNTIPALLDCTIPESQPDNFFGPPRLPGRGIGVAPFCINRHGKDINGLFLDWSIRRVGLKQLWTLKWNMQFDTANEWTKAGGVQPEDWPEWMRNFKDY
jgi:prepilin-type N-terminal cleavage/methylation domain-containing protein